MEGLHNLNALPDEIKSAIARQFGSVGQLYKKVFDLNNEDYRLFKTKPDGYNTRRSEIENELFDIQDKLDAIGVDGHDITTDISSDHGEIIVNKHVQQLDDYLRQFGTDFETMRIWMKETYGI